MEQELTGIVGQLGVVGGGVAMAFLWLTRSLIPSLQADAQKARNDFLEALGRVEQGCHEVQKQAIEVIQSNTVVVARVEKVIEMMKEGGDLTHGG